jgi:hypothetical protein
VTVHENMDTECLKLCMRVWCVLDGESEACVRVIKAYHGMNEVLYW